MPSEAKWCDVEVVIFAMGKQALVRCIQTFEHRFEHIFSMGEVYRQFQPVEPVSTPIMSETDLQYARSPSRLFRDCACIQCCGPYSCVRYGCRRTSHLPTHRAGLT